MPKDNSSIKPWFLIPVLIGLTLLVIGILFILSGVFIENPIMNSENWFNLHNAKLSRIYVGVFVASIGVLVIGMITPTFFFIQSKNKNKDSDSAINKANKTYIKNKQIVNVDESAREKNTLKETNSAKQNIDEEKFYYEEVTN